MFTARDGPRKRRGGYGMSLNKIGEEGNIMKYASPIIYTYFPKKSYYYYYVEAKKRRRYEIQK